YDEGIRNKEDVESFLINEGTRRQKIGVEYGLHLQNKIKREKIQKFGKLLDLYLDDIYEKYNFELYMKITGSYRRRKEESSDIDVIIWSEEDNAAEYADILIENLKNDGRILEELS